MLPDLAALALAPVTAAADAGPGRLAPKLLAVVARHLTDPGRKLPAALERANRRAWQALRVALGGDGLLARLASAEDRGLRNQLRTLIAAAPVGGDADFRAACLAELIAADFKPITGGKLDPAPLAALVPEWTALADPAAFAAQRLKWAGGLDGELSKRNKPHLRRLLAGPPDGNLVAAAAGYFFRREVERDPQLFAGLTLSKLDAMGGTLEAGFAGLADALDRHGDRLESLLGDLRESVLDIQTQLAGQSAQLREVGEAVRQLLDAHHLSRRPVRPGDSLSIRGDHERALVKAVVARYRALPAVERDKVPALLDGIGKLGVVAGDFTAAEADFKRVAELVSDPAARADSFHNAHLAALERRDWAGAYAAILEATKLDPKRLAPFPVGRFAFKKLLGAGGFGTVYLCREKTTAADRVVKALRPDGLGRDPRDVFAEAAALAKIDHPNVVRLHDHGWTDPDAKTRPFLVMDYFPGVSLEERVKAEGPLPAAEAVPLLRRVAAGLQAAHAAGVLHRDVKPANVLVKFAAGTWQVRLIDFGLAVSAEAMNAGSANTLLGGSVAGTIDYAAPEQLGRRSDPVGPAADVYGWARTACFALFGTPHPLPSQWRSIPTGLATLLEQCLDPDPARRPPTPAAVVGWLDGLTPPTPLVEAKPATHEASGWPLVVVAVAVAALVFLLTRPGTASTPGTLPTVAALPAPPVDDSPPPWPPAEVEDEVPADRPPRDPSVLERLAGTAWVGDNGRRLEWTDGGQALTGGLLRPARAVGPLAVEVELDGGPAKFVFDTDLTRFDRYGPDGRHAGEGRRAEAVVDRPPRPRVVADRGPGAAERPKRVAVWKVVIPGDVLLTDNKAEADGLARRFPGKFEGTKGSFVGVIGYGYADKERGKRLYRYAVAGGRHTFSFEPSLGGNHRREGSIVTAEAGAAGATVRLVFRKGAELECGPESTRKYFTDRGYAVTADKFYLFDDP